MHSYRRGLDENRTEARLLPFDIIVFDADGRSKVRSRQLTPVAALTHVLRLKPKHEVKVLDTETGEYLSLADLRSRALRNTPRAQAETEAVSRAERTVQTQRALRTTP